MALGSEQQVAWNSSFLSRASITSAGTSPGTWASFLGPSGYFSATSVCTFLSASLHSQLAKLLRKVFLSKVSMYASSCGVVHSTSNRWSLCLTRILKHELGSSIARIAGVEYSSRPPLPPDFCCACSLVCPSPWSGTTASGCSSAGKGSAIN